MDPRFDLQASVSIPAIRENDEPREPLYARIRIVPRAGQLLRPRLNLSFLLDASASMHHFVLSPDQRDGWVRRAESRGEIKRQLTDGRTGVVWTGQTLKELQQYVSTPMLSTLRGVWRMLEALGPNDSVSVLAFADKHGVVYADAGAETQQARLGTARGALATLGGGVDQSGLGRGTRLKSALEEAMARMGVGGDQPVVHRMLLVSDGVVEDREACIPMLETAVDRGLVISVIGVGEEFDEEFLMRVADLARGNYYYAATAPEVEQAFNAELGVMLRMFVDQATLTLRPTPATLINDVYPIAPSMGEFHAVWREQGGWRFRIGDLSAAQPPEFLVEMWPDAPTLGPVNLGAVQVEGRDTETGQLYSRQAFLNILSTNDPMLLQARDEEVLETVRRLEVYREERRYAAAEARGDLETATRHLQAATRMLKQMGNQELAGDMAAAAEEVSSGTRNLARTKRLKAGTRKLSGPRPNPSA